MFLIDTDVLSALRRRERYPEVARWMSKQRAADLYLSVVSVGEIGTRRHSSTALQPGLCAYAGTVARQCNYAIWRTHTGREYGHRAALGSAFRQDR